MIKKLLLSLMLLMPLLLSAQHNLLQSGPMLGYSEMREVLLWVQTNQPADVNFTYHNIESPEATFSTDTIRTGKKDAFTAKLIADEVMPGKRYHYDLHINGKKVDFPYPTEFQTQALWKWRTDPPDFTIAAGSCFYVNDQPLDRPGQPYGRNFEIFDHIIAKKPDAMIWIGDNVYYREPDWNTRTGMLYRYTHTRSQEYLQPLFASTHNYAIWDDHDYGPNNSDRSWFQKENALTVFKLFWGNLTYGFEDLPGLTSKFQWGDVDFFLLDNRYHRSANHRVTGEPTVLGKKQIQWLIDGLKSSNAAFKIIVMGGQMLNSVPKHETYINLAPEEREYILDTIEREAITDVIFLTGDRHITELSRLARKDGDSFWDLTVSPLTSGSWENQEDNKHRVDGTLVTEQNFALMHFKGPRKERRIEIEIYNHEGVLQWKKEIEQFKPTR